MTSLVAASMEQLRWIRYRYVFWVSLFEKLWNGYSCGGMQMIHWVLHLGFIVGDSLSAILLTFKMFPSFTNCHLSHHSIINK
jgi:hypothetical protein